LVFYISLLLIDFLEKNKNIKRFRRLIIVMKEKKDCKECGTPLKEWQIKRAYDLCLDCYNEMKSKKFKTVHELLQEKAIEEE